MVITKNGSVETSFMAGRSLEDLRPSGVRETPSGTVRPRSTEQKPVVVNPFAGVKAVKASPKDSV